MRRKAIEVCRETLELLERTRDALTPAQVGVFVDAYEQLPPHPVVAAYFTAATDHLSRYLRRVRSARVPPSAR